MRARLHHTATAFQAINQLARTRYPAQTNNAGHDRARNDIKLSAKPKSLNNATLVHGDAPRTLAKALRVEASTCPTATNNLQLNSTLAFHELQKGPPPR